MKLVTPTQQAIIKYLVSENEETGEPNPLDPYMRAMEGRVEPDMRFTLCCTNIAGLILYVQEEPIEELNTRRTAVKKRLLEIAGFIVQLAQEGYVRTLVKEPSRFPPDIPEQWKPYKDFSLSERKTLLFAASMQIIPRLKLYDYWEEIQHTNRQVKVKVPERTF